LAGAPGAARAIGGAMASNPLPVIIPCHRVVAGDGRLTGYTAPGGIACKEYLLRLEDVEIKGQRIFLKNESYKQVNLA
jgi:methylated-DNA-[protein]-cysteine S-methyltransferase